MRLPPMIPDLLTLVTLLLLSGCVAWPTSSHSNVEPSAEERFAADAVRARYRAIVDAQQPKPASSDSEIVTITRPARSEDGVIREATMEEIRVLRLP